MQNPPTNERTESLYQQFVEAAERRDEETVIRLIRQHPELHSFVGDAGGLLDVISNNCREYYESAFRAGLSPDSETRLVLQEAACDNDLELARLCLHHGADLERRNEEGETALGYAVSWGSLEIVRLLVEAGADVNAVEKSPDGDQNTALDCASPEHPEIARVEIWNFLRAHGAKKFSEL